MSYNTTLKNLIDDDVCPLKSGSKLIFEWEDECQFHRYIGTLDDNGYIHCTIKDKDCFKSLSSFGEYILQIISTRTSCNGWREVKDLNTNKKLQEYRSEYEATKTDSRVSKIQHVEWTENGKWKKAAFRKWDMSKQSCHKAVWNGKKKKDGKRKQYKWVDEWSYIGKQGEMGFTDKLPEKEGSILQRRVFQRDLTQIEIDAIDAQV